MNAWSEKPAGKIPKIPDLINRYGFENWTGKSVSDDDAARIEAAVYTASANSRIGLFHSDLIESGKAVGWKLAHPMTLWTVALYANVFPIIVPEPADQDHLGKIHFSTPDVALSQSQLNFFWGDRDLVCLAMKRQKAPGKDYPAWQRPGARPYQRW